MQDIIVLDAERIKSLLEQEGFNQSFQLQVFSSIDSTNRYLKDLPASSQLTFCCAETQTQGRGRFGRAWHSPSGENIYFSSRWRLPCSPAKLSGLSLITGLAILATLKSYLPDAALAIKWPNDILWQQKKLCGILIELLPEQQVIIGIGLNVNFDTLNNPLPERPWCSLFEISQRRFDRNVLLVRLISMLEQYINRFMREDFSVFMSEWSAADYLAGKSINVMQSGKAIYGIAEGIDVSGQLILRDQEGKIQYLSSGECSLRNE